jgi:hypothetical protein
MAQKLLGPPLFEALPEITCRKAAEPRSGFAEFTLRSSGLPLGHHPKRSFHYLLILSGRNFSR